MLESILHIHNQVCPFENMEPNKYTKKKYISIETRNNSNHQIVTLSGVGLIELCHNILPQTIFRSNSLTSKSFIVVSLIVFLGLPLPFIT